MLDQAPPFRRAARIDGIEISLIVRIAEAAAQMRLDGQNIVSLSTGAPDFPTPVSVIEAAHQAALDGQTGYTATAGTDALRDAVAEEYHSERAQVVISAGAKQVLTNAMLATLDPGDEVLMPAPYWTTYSDIVTMSGGTTVTVPCSMDQGFKLTPEALERAITPKTKWLMLNSPSNPTGAIYTIEEFSGLAKVLERHPHVWVLTDEIYEHLSYVPFTSFAKAAPELADRTLIVSGVSKAWAMTGWRIGWGVGPEPLISAMVAVQGQVTSGACSISQAAALAALEGDRSVLAVRLASFKSRRALIVDGLNTLPGFTCPNPDGAFYVFPNIEGLMQMGGFVSCTEACEWLLNTAQVAIVPGSAFGLHGHARISFAYSPEDLTEGLSRIADTLSLLR